MTRRSREEAKCRVVHTKLAYKRLAWWRSARKHGDDSTTKCLLKIVPWETKESVVSARLSVPKDLTCVPATSTAGKVPRVWFVSGSTVRSGRRGRRDGEVHTRGVRVSVEFCKRCLSADMRKERNMPRWSTLQLHWHTIHFDRAYECYDIPVYVPAFCIIYTS